MFVIYKDAGGYFRWRLLSAGNYKIIADSAESYVRKDDCMAGINLVKSIAPSAPISDKT